MTIKQDFAQVKGFLEGCATKDQRPDYTLTALSRIEAELGVYQELLDQQRNKKKIAQRSARDNAEGRKHAEAERDTLKAALEGIGGLLDYWGNEGGWHDEHAIKCFRAVEEVLRRAFDQLEEKR